MNQSLPANNMDKARNLLREIVDYYRYPQAKAYTLHSLIIKADIFLSKNDLEEAPSNRDASDVDARNLKCEPSHRPDEDRIKTDGRELPTDTRVSEISGLQEPRLGERPSSERSASPVAQNLGVNPMPTVTPPASTESKSFTVDEVVEAIRDQPNESEWQLNYGDACRLVDQYASAVSLQYKGEIEGHHISMAVMRKEIVAQQVEIRRLTTLANENAVLAVEWRAEVNRLRQLLSGKS